VLIWNQSNTHIPVPLYKAFPPVEARRLLDRLEFHYTPKHDNWLDITEIELSVFTAAHANATASGATTPQPATQTKASGDIERQSQRKPPEPI